MGVYPGQALIAIDPFRLLRVKIVPSDEDSASCGALADLFQSVTAIHYAFLIKCKLRFFIEIITQTVFKNRGGGKDEFPCQVLLTWNDG